MNTDTFWRTRFEGTAIVTVDVVNVLSNLGFIAVAKTNKNIKI